MNSPDWLTGSEEWPQCPANVRFAFTTRSGGASRPPYNGLNLGLHVDDDSQVVQQNRTYLQRELGIQPPAWLKQVHGTTVAVDPVPGERPPQADAAWTARPGVPLAVLTADCLPVLVATRDGAEVGVAHAGWRGLADGVLPALVTRFQQTAENLVACLGPAIGPTAFEVGPEVRSAFLREDPATVTAFKPGRGDRWYGDLYQLARQSLGRVGVTAVSGGRYCTYTDDSRFFSYRRDGRTGRMAALIWIDGDQPGH